MNRRVMHVVRTNGVSGAENHLATLIAELPAFGWTADVLLAVPDPDALAGFARQLATAGGRVRTLRMTHDVSPQLLRALRAALAGQEHDLVHTHLVHADWHAALASIGIRRPRLVSTKHNHDPFRARRPARALEAAALRRCAGSIAISSSLADFVESNHGIRPETVLYGWPPGPGRTDYPDVVSRLLAVGRLEPQKGFDVLIEAIALLRGRGADVTLDIAGEGGQRAALERLIEDRGLRDRVRLLGLRSDVADLMASADVLVHTARWEGFGLVLLEAMSAGLPIVATAVGAIPEVVAADETALLVRPDDAKAFADAVQRLVSEPGEARRLGMAGHERLRTRFGPGEMARRTAEVYDGAVTAVAR